VGAGVAVQVGARVGVSLGTGVEVQVGSRVGEEVNVGTGVGVSIISAGDGIRVGVAGGKVCGREVVVTVLTTTASSDKVVSTRSDAGVLVGVAVMRASFSNCIPLSARITSRPATTSNRGNCHPLCPRLISDIQMQ
jgi:hypothetical protein